MSNLPAVIEDNGAALMPVMQIQQAAMRRQAIVEFSRQIMVKGVDFGVVPGTGDKPTLLKPGAEKLTTFFGLSPRFEIVEKELDWMGGDHDGEPFYYFHYRCSLYRGQLLVGEGLGSCNLWEKKYRYRNAAIKCPNCGQEAVIKGKQEYGGGWLCWAKKDGCNSKWPDGEAAIENQPRGKVLNDSPADLVNTIDKMAQKRALVAATLIAVNASEFFTQDVEDMDFGSIVEGVIIEEKPTNGNGKKPVQKPPQKPPQKAATYRGDVVDSDGRVFENEKEPESNGVDWREKVETGSNMTLRTVCSIVNNACAYYGDDMHAFNALAEYPFPDDMAHDLNQRVNRQEALAVYDWLIDRASEKADQEAG